MSDEYLFVMPAQAGIQGDPGREFFPGFRLRGSDERSRVI
jgi:hypothetical protein